VIANVSTILGESGTLDPLYAAAAPLVFIGMVSIRVFLKAQ